MNKIDLDNGRITLIHGDCLAAIHKFVDYRTVTMVFADLPYGTTECKWDVLIDPKKLWEELHSVGKLNASFHLMSGDWPFYKMANVKNYKYSNYWDKGYGVNFTQVKFQPFFAIETIEVYCRQNKMIYNPQMIERDKPTKTNGKRPHPRTHKGEENTRYFETNKVYTHKHPTNILRIQRTQANKTVHPTEKPVELLEYLILTYTNPGDLVLDPTMGSGTTVEACINTGRRVIGVDLSEEYFNIAIARIINRLLEKQNEDTAPVPAESNPVMQDTEHTDM